MTKEEFDAHQHAKLAEDRLHGATPPPNRYARHYRGDVEAAILDGDEEMMGGDF